MKLHLPVALLRAVMALFASQVALTTACADDAQPSTITHNIDADVTYVYDNTTEGWSEEWNKDWRADEIVITSDEEHQYSVSFIQNPDCINGFCVINANKVAIENLKSISFDGWSSNSNSSIFSAVEYDIRNNDAVNYTNNAGVVLTEPGNDYSIMRFVDNGEINITGNSAYLEGHFTLGTAIEDIKDVLITGTKRDITMSSNSVESGREWVSGSAVRLEGKLTFAGNQGNIDVSHNTGKIISGNSGDAHGGAILAFGVEITGTGGDISFNDNAVYTEGRDYAGGGAISSTGSEEIEVDGVLVGVKLLGNITLSDNLGNIEFNGNKVQSGSKDAYDTDMLQVAAGGAMVAQGKVEISGNKGNLIAFNSNSVEAEVNSAGGGAIAVIGAVEIAENKADVEALTAEDENAGNKLEFKNNSVSSLSDSVCGGAIYSSNDELISVAQDNLGIDYATAESLVNQLVPTYVSIDNNDDVSFIDNSITSGEVDADGKAVGYGDFADGGAIYSEGEVSLSNNADVEFSGNTATSIGSSVRGGAVYSEASVDISGNEAVTFDGNQATAYQVEYKNEYNTYYQYGSAYGGAIYMYSYPEVAGVSITGNSGLVSFTDNMAYSERGSAYGGAIYCEGDVTLQGNLAGVSFIGNKVVTGIVDENGNVLVPGSSAYGGAIYARDGVTIMGNSGNITFNDNKAIATESSANGGAIYSDVSVSIKENTGDITFNNNVIESCYWAEGAAIYADEIVEIVGIGYADGKTPGNLTFKGNSISVSDSGGNGASIHGEHGVTLSHNGNILFKDNWVYTEDGSARGAGIGTCTSEPPSVEEAVSINSNGNVSFINNDTSAFGSSSHGGAIHSYYGSVDISNNKDIVFENNDVASRDNSESGGGAIYSEFGASIKGNGDVTISSNTSSSQGGNVYGGAINTDRGSIVINENKAVTISNNRVTAVGSFMKEVVDVDAEGNEVIVGTERADSQITAGGALASNQNVEISSNKGDILFSQNSVTETKVDEVLNADGFDGSGENPQLPHMAGAGAIGAGKSLSMVGNQGNISFEGNSVSSECKGVYGGAIATIGGFVNISNTKGNADTVGALQLEDGTALTLGAVNFSNNSAIATGSSRNAYGGAIATYTDSYGGGQVVMTGNESVSFHRNSVSATDGSVFGGAIYAANVVVLSDNGSVSFTENKIVAHGNASDAFGGAIHAADDVTINNNTNGVNFTGNTIQCGLDSDGFGGAIYAGQNSGDDVANQAFDHNVTLSGNGNVAFADNKIVSEFRARGGAIYADGYITLSDNGDVVFTGNSVKSDDGGSAIGGAISTYLVKSQDGKVEVYQKIPVGVTLEGNNNITFSGNSTTSGRASANGGAIYSAGKIDIIGNSGNILFKENTNTAGSAYVSCGGALAGFNGVNISDNTGESIKFIGNVSSSDGGFSGAGAVYSAYDDVSIVNNVGVDIEFSNNRVEGIGKYQILGSDGETITECGDVIIGGGAIGSDGSSVNIKNNGLVSFDGNSVIDKDGTAPIPSINVDSVENTIGISATGGGAVMALQNVEICNNEGVSIKGNSSSSDSRLSMGGAIVALGSVSISHNKGDVNVSGNYAASKTGTATGGAIFAQNGLSIVNNEGNVTFSGNYVKNGDNHQLNSVVVKGGKVELAAVEGKSISFYDSVLVGAGSDMVLNSYTDASGQKQTSTGAIVFSGANAVETLQQLKGEGGTVSAGEISASLTSQINREVSVAGGSLQVKDGAVLQMLSLGVNNGADLLIGAGSTVAVGSTVTFDAGSEYTVQGLKAATTLSTAEAASSTPTAQIIGNVELTAGMTYTMDGAYTKLVGSANELAFKDSGTYTFNVDESVAYTEGTTKYFVLFTGVDKLTGAELGLDSTVLTGVDFLTNIGYYDDIMLHYLNHETAGGVLYISATVPEPTTATLSLLALAALAARRRRK